MLALCNVVGDEVSNTWSNPLKIAIKPVLMAYFIKAGGRASPMVRWALTSPWNLNLE